jgi:hypothetical protein
MFQIEGQKALIGIFTVMNEFEEIRLQLFVQSTCRSELVHAFENMVKTQQFLKQGEIKVFYTDVCYQDSRFLRKVIPSLEKDVQEPSLLPLAGIEIIVIKISSRGAIKNADGYKKFVDKCQSTSETIVGFDTEWTGKVLR